MVKKNTCVFISGHGSNLKNLIQRSRDNIFPINIKLIITNNKKAYGINYAKKYLIPCMFIDTKLKNYENKILSLPIFPEMTEEQIIYVCSSIKSFYLG